VLWRSPLDFVIDGVITQKHSRVPFVGHWLDTLTVDRTHLLYGAPRRAEACAR